MRNALRAVALWTVAILAVAMLSLAAASTAEELVVAGAVSVREPLVEIGRAFEQTHEDVTVRVAFGASSVLAAQLRAGAPIDVLVSADERIVDDLEAEGLVPAGRRATLAENRLVVMAARSVPLERPDDLLGPDLRRIAVPEHAVPVGRYAREWLARRALLDGLEGRIVPTEHARATLAAVDHGHADAAIVYATDARLSRSARVAFAVPEAEQPRIVYAAAVSSNAPHAALAQRFLVFLGEDEATRVLEAAGFRVPDR